MNSSLFEEYREYSKRLSFLRFVTFRSFEEKLSGNREFVTFRSFDGKVNNPCQFRSDWHSLRKANSFKSDRFRDTVLDDSAEFNNFLDDSAVFNNF